MAAAAVDALRVCTGKCCGLMMTFCCAKLTMLIRGSKFKANPVTGRRWDPLCRMKENV